jgi:uncharacterized phage protein gp47/JayE
MPVNKVTATQFAAQLNQSIQDRNSSYDTELGPIPDVQVNPTSNVLEEQNDRIRDVSNLILLSEVEGFEDVDVDNFVFNEFLIRNLGGKSSGTVVFSRATAPQIDIPVQRGFPIATSPDEETGETVVFITTEAKTLTVSTASSFFNIETERYELEVAVQATVAGSIGEVGPNRITRPLRPLSGFDTVTNRNRTSPATDRETNSELLERYKIAIPGTQLSVRSGIELFVRGNYPDAGDILVVTAGDPLITRTGEGGNAIDVFVTGSQSTSRSDSQQFIGLGQLIILENQPVVSITNVPGYVAGTDYEFVKDTTGVSDSPNAQDGIRFLVGGASPSVGSSFSVEYEQNILLSNIQSAFSDADNDVGGQDILIRSGTQVDITLTAVLTVVQGFSFSTVRSAVITAITSFINGLGLGDTVEKSDIQLEVRRVNGVDNFVFLLLDRVGGTGNADVEIEKNEFPSITSGDITVT